MEYRFHIPNAEVEPTRRAVQSPQFRESLRLREALGYLPGDRTAIVETAPAVLLRGLTVTTQGAATATLEPLGTLEGQIVRALAERLDSDEYSFVLHRAGYSGRPEGMDFELAAGVTRGRLVRVLRDVFDDADDIAQALVTEPSRQPARPQARQAMPSRPAATRRQPRPASDNGMIGQGLIDRVREQERQEAEEREAKERAAEYARRTGDGDESMMLQRF